MRKIYQNAKAVLIWVGPDSEDHQARVAIDSIITISDFLCRELGIPVSDLNSVDNLYQEIMAKYRDVLPVPNQCDFSTEALWQSLLWFYKHPYFTRVWAIQEVNANKERWLHCGLEKVLWDRVSLVALLHHNGNCILESFWLHGCVLLVGSNCDDRSSAAK